VRAPGGGGKIDVALHEVTALDLAGQALGAIKSRNDTNPRLTSHRFCSAQADYSRYGAMASMRA
jgi:hypothetical protein